MKKYEIMFIVKTTIGEDEVKATSKKFQDVLKKDGAKNIEVEEMGQRELAYEIKKFKSGYYYLYFVEANNDEAINEFDRLAGISADVIRHLITKIED